MNYMCIIYNAKICVEPVSINVTTGQGNSNRDPITLVFIRENISDYFSHKSFYTSLHDLFLMTAVQCSKIQHY